MKKTHLLFIVAMLLPLHSKTLLNCGGGSDDDFLSPTGTTEETDPPVPVAELPDMKVVVFDLNPTREADLFYIRSAYNEQKDLIVLYRQNSNGVISLKSVYIGSSELSDAEMMEGGGVSFDLHDSTAPLFGASQYWHLFAQHGYIVPTINNSVGLTAGDVGAVYRDQAGRGYTIGNVTASKITLLPILGHDERNRDIRRWQSPSSPAITSLTHISGGVKPTIFSPTGYGYTQLRPVMSSMNRKLVADGKEITAAGTYTAKSLRVSEEQDGYDPATVTTWFPVPDLTSAQVMAHFTWQYDFCGAQCAVHTTIEFRRSVEFQFYGAIQQQTFFDTGDYKAMFMIPKAAPQAGVQLDRPFHSPASTARSYRFYRTPEYMKNADDPIDRMLAFLYNDQTDDYLIGMAAGLSLVGSDTQTATRVGLLPAGTQNPHYRIGLFSPSDRNKFYIAAFTTAPFEGNDYYVPNTLRHDIDYYLSFFDPAENEGQVYWYKDGERYVIYAHCQSQHERQEIRVPAFMEGLSLRVIEQSDDAELLTNTIQNASFSVAYHSNEANYLVVAAEKI